MERSWLDTVQLLGLDVVLGVVLAVLVIERWSTVVDRISGAGRRARRARSRPDADTSHSPWPPQEWRPTH
jgi:hypothetical protein